MKGKFVNFWFKLLGVFYCQGFQKLGFHCSSKFQTFNTVEHLNGVWKKWEYSLDSEENRGTGNLWKAGYLGGGGNLRVGFGWVGVCRPGLQMSTLFRKGLESKRYLVKNSQFLIPPSIVKIVNDMLKLLCTWNITPILENGLNIILYPVL